MPGHHPVLDVCTLAVQRERAQRKTIGYYLAPRKAADAETDDTAQKMRSRLSSTISPDAYVESAIDAMHQLDEFGQRLGSNQLRHVIERTVVFCHMLWEHGALQGFDVSALSDELARLEPEADEPEEEAESD